MVIPVSQDQRRLPSIKSVEDDIILDRSFFDELLLPSTTNTDYDIYLLEALWPILARALATLSLEVGASAPHMSTSTLPLVTVQLLKRSHRDIMMTIISQFPSGVFKKIQKVAIDTIYSKSTLVPIFRGRINFIIVSQVVH